MCILKFVCVFHMYDMCVCVKDETKGQIELDEVLTKGLV